MHKKEIQEIPIFHVMTYDVSKNKKYNFKNSFFLRSGF